MGHHSRAHESRLRYIFSSLPNKCVIIYRYFSNFVIFTSFWFLAEILPETRNRKFRRKFRPETRKVTTLQQIFCGGHTKEECHCCSTWTLALSVAAQEMARRLATPHLDPRQSTANVSRNRRIAVESQLSSERRRKAFTCVEHLKLLGIDPGGTWAAHSTRSKHKNLKAFCGSSQIRWMSQREAARAARCSSTASSACRPWAAPSWLVLVELHP